MGRKDRIDVLGALLLLSVMMLFGFNQSAVKTGEFWHASAVSGWSPVPVCGAIDFSLRHLPQQAAKHL